jgi:hypothetical protein
MASGATCPEAIATAATSSVHAASIVVHGPRRAPDKFREQQDSPYESRGVHGSVFGREDSLLRAA